MKKINFKKIFSIKNTAFLLFIFVAVFLFGHFTLAESPVAGALGNVVGIVIAFFIRAISSILILLVGVLMDVAVYSDFIHADAVSKGWVVVRDLCNMFFVVVLLVIAFATILGQEEYGAKKMLPKLIMAAVLINFSKLICGLMIDLSNVVMLTFVNAFSAIGAGNILNMLGITDVTQIAVGDDKAAVTFGVIISAYIFGLIYIVIATVVIAAMLGMLVIRLVMIWILVVLSPLAFFLQAVPGKGAQYAGQWWSKWTSNLLVGPIIAFFLWLSFASLQGGSPIKATENTELTAANANIEAASGVGSKAGTASSMSKFVIAIGMLLAGMKIAQEVGGEAGGAMGKIFSKGKGMATAAGIGALAAGGKWTGRTALAVGGNIANIPAKIISKDWNKRNALGNFALGWRDDLKDSNKKSKKEAVGKYLKKVGIGDKGSERGETLIDTKGFQIASNMVKGATVGALTGGFGLAAGTVGTAIAGGGIGTVLGTAGGAVREKAKKTIKEHDSAENDFTKANLDYDSKKKEYEGHENFKQEFDDNLSDFQRLEGEKNAPATAAAFAADANKVAEYREKNAFVKDKDNIKKSVEANKYLSKPENLTELNDKEAEALSKKADFDSLDEKKYKAAKVTEKVTKFLGFERFVNTKAAMSDNTKDQTAAKAWVKEAAASGGLLKNSGAKGSIYSSTGLSKTWKNRFDQLNKGGGDNDKVISDLVSEINSNSTKPEKLEELARAYAAYSGGSGVNINSTSLGQVSTALNGKGENPDKYKNISTRNYKGFNEDKMTHNPGSGELQFDTFAKNSAKAPVDRKVRKDIMGVSFDKFNQRAKDRGVDYKLDTKTAGVNQKVNDADLSKLSDVMSSLIDDEIVALQRVANNLGNDNTSRKGAAEKISQLNTAKTRLKSGDMSGMSLKNSDIKYSGEDDSEKRRNEYNSTQHENMHQYGAKDESTVDNATNALQEAKLVGRIPQSDSESGGKAYEEVLGKMIANMEQSGASQEAMNQAILSQVEKWSPSNAQRVVETEKGERDTVKDVVSDTKSSVDTEKLTAAIDKLTESLDKPLKVTGGSGGNVSKIGLDIPTTNFFRRMFTGVKESVNKGDEKLGEKLKPLSAMAVSEEINNVTEEL